MHSTVLTEIIAFLLGRKYYANIIATKGVAKQEICSYIFAHEKENNTIQDTLLEAIKAGADLYGADLGEEWGKLSSNTDIFIAGPLGSRNAYTMFYHTDKGIFVRCGCFRGTLAAFCDKVKETHNNNDHAHNYLALVDFVKIKWNL